MLQEAPEGLDSIAVSETLPGLTLTASSEVASYGFWGEHGFAVLALGAGSMSGTIEGTAYGGDFSTAQAYAVGDATGTNPAGTGSATWTGIAEASPTGAAERLTGTATATVADLSRPRIGVAIEVPGHAIGAPGWADMPLADGRFASGTAGTDYLGGSFHGPAHEEAGACSTHRRLHRRLRGQAGAVNGRRGRPGCNRSPATGSVP